MDQLFNIFSDWKILKALCILCINSTFNFANLILLNKLYWMNLKNKIKINIVLKVSLTISQLYFIHIIKILKTEFLSHIYFFVYGLQGIEIKIL